MLSAVQGYQITGRVKSWGLDLNQRSPGYEPSEDGLSSTPTEPRIVQDQTGVKESIRQGGQVPKVPGRTEPRQRQPTLRAPGRRHVP